jgi:hypothetical protein
MPERGGDLDPPQLNLSFVTFPLAIYLIDRGVGAA